MTRCGPLPVGFDATSLEVEGRTGVGQYTARLLEALIERQDKWRFRLLHCGRLRGRIPEGAECPPASRLPNRTLWMQISLPLELSRLHLPLCHFTNFLAPLMTPCPYVVTIHDMSLFKFGSMHTRKSLWAVRSLLPTVARRAAAVISVSESARRDIVAVLGVHPQRVEVIHEAPGAAFRVLDEPGECLRVSAAYDLREPFILSVCTIQPRKNLRRLLAAFARLVKEGRREQMVFVGQLGWKYRALLREIEGMRLKDRVRILGYVPDGDMPAIYSLAKVLAFPSLYEGFGLPIVEAMACGTPVLTSDCSSMPEVAGDAALLVDPSSSESIAEGLERILADDGLRTRLREAGLARAAQFSWARAAAETARLYEKIVRPSLIIKTQEPRL